MRAIQDGRRDAVAQRVGDNLDKRTVGGCTCKYSQSAIVGGSRRKGVGPGGWGRLPCACLLMNKQQAVLFTYVICVHMLRSRKVDTAQYSWCRVG